jgi:hypothetical protein
MTDRKPLPRVTAVRVVEPYGVELSFTDGAHGTIDLRSWIVGRGPVFKPLEDPTFFAQVRLGQDGGTIEWPNGVDFCPDVLYAQLTGKPVALPADPKPEPLAR